MKKTIMQCPNCGTKLMLVGSEVSDVANMTRAQKKLKALKDANIPVDDYLAIGSFSDTGVDNSAILFIGDGTPSIVADDDPIFTSILNGDTINNAKLFRRWITAQVFHSLAGLSGNRLIDLYNERITRKGYEYQVKMLLEELAFQTKAYNEDRENYNLRNAWFNKELATAFVAKDSQYISEMVTALEPRTRKGVSVIRLHGRGFIRVDDIQKKLFTPMQKAYLNVMRADNPRALYEAFKHYCKVRVTLKYTHDFVPAWTEAYNGAGAYFSLRNLILFSGCRIKSVNGEFLSMNASLSHIDALAEALSGVHRGSTLLENLVKILEYNNINVSEKIAEWKNR